jgi:hypothetical protein
MSGAVSYTRAKTNTSDEQHPATGARSMSAMPGLDIVMPHATAHRPTVEASS